MLRSSCWELLIKKRIWMGYGGATWQQQCQAVRLLSDIFRRINDRKNTSLAACSVYEIYENLLVSSTSSSIDSNLLEVAGIITVPVKHQEVLQMLHQKEYRSWQNLHIQNFFKFKRSGSVLEVPRYRKYFSTYVSHVDILIDMFWRWIYFTDGIVQCWQSR